MNNKLLTEAIADAKAVKETAIANAKLSLEEAFTPHLKSMLSAKLQELDKDEEEFDEKDEVKEMDDVSYKLKNGASMDSVPHKVGQSTVNEEEEVEEEINLDELLAELEENSRTDAEEEGYKDGMKDEKEDLMNEDARTDAEEEGYLDGEKDEKEDSEDGLEDAEIDLEDLSEDDLKSFIEDVIKDMVSKGEIEPGDEFEEENEDEEVEVEDETSEDDTDVEVEIDEAKKDKMSDPVMRHGEKGDDEAEKETEKMRFKEAMDQINALKVELQEVNLLNAKLLYTNKIFKAKNLTEDKKVKVLKAFDNAKDVKQAKTIFDTLSEGLIMKTPHINEVKGSASKASGLEPKATVQPIIESNDVYNRMRKLAGLI
jgi:hypothetical protein